MELEKEFIEFAKIIKYGIMKERVIKYYKDLSELVPSVESAEEKYNNMIKNMTLEHLEKLAQNAWLDEVEQCLGKN